MNNTQKRPLGWTTIEESRKLVEAGLKPESADMHYTVAEFDPEGDNNSSYAEYYNILYADNEVAYCSDRVVPCWSLGALESLLPEKIVVGEYEIDIRKYPLTDSVTLYQIAYGSRNSLSGSWHDMISTAECETLIEAVMDMVVWLLNNRWCVGMAVGERSENG